MQLKECCNFETGIEGAKLRLIGVVPVFHQARDLISARKILMCGPELIECLDPPSGRKPCLQRQETRKGSAGQVEKRFSAPDEDVGVAVAGEWPSPDHG